MNNTAAKIRDALKSAGFNARAVSVRVGGCSTSESVHVTIRRADVSKAAVEEVALKFAEVSRDHATGEILCGGNTYVDVEYARAVINAMAAPYVAAILGLHAGDSCRFRGWTVTRTEESGGLYYRATKRSASRAVYCWGSDFCARQMAELDASTPRVHVRAIACEVM